MKTNANYNNLVVIGEANEELQEFRAYMGRQHGEHFNHIVVTCSPKYNGWWSYPAERLHDCKLIMEKDVPCVRVPISICTLQRRLEEITDSDIVKDVIKIQKKWYKDKTICYPYRNMSKPEWML